MSVAAVYAPQRPCSVAEGSGWHSESSGRLLPPASDVESAFPALVVAQNTGGNTGGSTARSPLRETQKVAVWRVNIGLKGWRPRRDLNPCYRRESGMAKRNSNKLQEHGCTGWRSRSSKKHFIVSPMCPRPFRDSGLPCPFLTLETMVERSLFRPDINSACKYSEMPPGAVSH